MGIIKSNRITWNQLMKRRLGDRACRVPGPRGPRRFTDYTHCFVYFTHRSQKTLLQCQFWGKKSNMKLQFSAWIIICGPGSFVCIRNTPLGNVLFVCIPLMMLLNTHRGGLNNDRSTIDCHIDSKVIVDKTGGFLMGGPSLMIYFYYQFGGVTGVDCFWNV